MNVEVIFIYLDVYFLLNFLIDYICLYTSCAIFRKKATAKTLTLSTLIGGVISVASLFLSSPFIIFPLYFISSCLICSIAGKSFDVRCLFTFIFCQYLIGGILNSFSSVTGTQAKLTSSLLILLFLVPFIFYILKTAKKSIDCVEVGAKIEILGKTCEFSLLVDSGNLVIEPTTRRRVIFIGKDAFSRLLKNSPLPSNIPVYNVFIKTPAGERWNSAFVPDKITFDNSKYNRENYLILPASCKDFAGFDGIVPLIK